MTRLLILVTILLFIVSNVSAQYVDSLNTVLGPVTQGARVSVTWSLLPGVDATGKNGDLSATDSATKNVIPIDPAVPLAPKSYLWEVKVPPGTYTLGLNDGAGLKQSGEVVVKAPAGGAPAGGAPAGGAPAGAPPATPPASAPPAGKAPSSAPAPPSPGTSDNTPPPAGSTPSSASAPSPSSGAATTPASGSASTIFSGYEVIFSLLGVAIAMVQF